MDTCPTVTRGHINSGPGPSHHHYPAVHTCATLILCKTTCMLHAELAALCIRHTEDCRWVGIVPNITNEQINRGTSRDHNPETT
jgi:hypothetical protein